MKNLNLPKFLFFAIGLCLFWVDNSPVLGQSYPSANCQSTNTAEINKKGWPQGSTVYYYVDPAMPVAKRGRIIDAFNNWDASGNLNGSQVRYQMVTDPATANYTVLNEQLRLG